MAIYAIGDIQGCYRQLQKLLEKIKFSSDKDQLWFAGDIVNRGPESLKTIRFIKSLEDNAITILGNHDLHLLAMSHGHHKQGKRDTVQEILDASDSNQLLEWLIHRPLMHFQKENNVCLVHAGMHPSWTTSQALSYANEVEAVLQGPKAHEFFHHMYGDKPSSWSESLSGWDRLRFITNCFTRMRYINDDMKLRLKEKGSPGKQPANTHPWFEFNKKEKGLNIVFGHWSTLKNPNIKNLFPLDTGCLWGGELTALIIDENLNLKNNSISIKCPTSRATY